VRFLKNLLIFFGAAFIGTALGAFGSLFLPLYHLDDIVTASHCSLVFALGTALLLVAHGIHRRAMFAWWLGGFTYILCAGYFFWRGCIRLELASYCVFTRVNRTEPFCCSMVGVCKALFC